MKGYWKKLLKINLTHKKIETEKIPKEVITKYLGAKGIGAYYFMKDLPQGIDPFSPENRIILATGPFQGTDILSTGRFATITKSPLTGIFLDTYCGGMFGPSLKRCGFDLVIIEGRAEKPVYISITNEMAQIKDATNLWGKTTAEAEKYIKSQEGKETKVVSIGIAGENRVLFSCLISEKRRASGRGGAGAVFGSKNLKAIAVNGTMNISVHDPQKIKELNQKATQAVKQMHKNKVPFYFYGTSWAIEYAHKTDRLPTLNFKKGEWEHYKGLNGDTIYRENKIIQNPCCPCPIACGGIISEGKDRPEYETLAMLGANCGLKNYQAVVEANELCNLYGLDTISTGNVIAFAMECAEKGIIKEEIKFGDEKTLLSLIEEIALGKGIGAQLGLGTKRLSKIWGNDCSSFAMNVKGLELPAWNCRGKLGQGLAYMTADIGGSHLRDALTDHSPPKESALKVVKELIETQNKNVIRDNYIICAFALFTVTPEMCAEYFKAVTGQEINEEKIQEIGNRIFTLIRSFNCREGISRKDDQLPLRALKEGLPSGVAQGCKAFISEEDKEQCLDEYYQLRGWDKNGIPKRETLKRLGIDF
ncbi:MAG: putative oxidoreductase YdhV [Candidatus Methanoperedenaceae archaeon GB50]|nr:MAG: putative oxidoreductase YdhV [Candidatus Methanoperedenaceae archaeon GB50]CAD7771875.1 putative oxidoreductase YdhV [Candidatus Methanoperedenaceae archaeon GB50]